MYTFIRSVWNSHPIKRGGEINMWQTNVGGSLISRTAFEVFILFFWFCLRVWNQAAQLRLYWCARFICNSCLRRRGGSARCCSPPLAALAIISCDRMKLYWAACFASLLFNSCVCYTAPRQPVCDIADSGGLEESVLGLSPTAARLLLLWSLLDSVQVQCDVDFVACDSTAEVFFLRQHSVSVQNWQEKLRLDTATMVNSEKTGDWTKRDCS